MRRRPWPEGRLMLGTPRRNLWTASLDVATPTLRLLFRIGLLAAPFVVLYCNYGGQP